MPPADVLPYHEPDRRTGEYPVGLKELLLPHDTIFYDLFEKQAGLVTEAAVLLVNLTDDFTDVKGKRHAIERIEHKGDQVTHEIYGQLNRTFITPLDPEEISRLASTMDDVLDGIDGAAEMMQYYSIAAADPHMAGLARLIHQQAKELESAIRSIRSLTDPRYVEERCIEVNRLENLADDALAQAITELFRTTDAIAIIRLKDIYEQLETTTDRCEDVANTLSDIAIRHS